MTEVDGEHSSSSAFPMQPSRQPRPALSWTKQPVRESQRCGRDAFREIPTALPDRRIVATIEARCEDY